MSKTLQFSIEREEGELSEDETIIREQIKAFETKNEELQKIEELSSSTKKFHTVHEENVSFNIHHRNDELTASDLSSISSLKLLSRRREWRKNINMKRNKRTFNSEFYRNRHRSKHKSATLCNRSDIAPLSIHSHDYNGNNTLNRENLRIALKHSNTSQTARVSLKDRLSTKHFEKHAVNGHSDITLFPSVHSMHDTLLDVKDSDDGLEETELRLIALKSAVIKKHLARKTREADSAYSPTKFHATLSVHTDSEEIYQTSVGMNVSPLSSPRMLLKSKSENDKLPLNLAIAHSYTNNSNELLDMDIVSSDSDVEIDSYNIQQKQDSKAVANYDFSFQSGTMNDIRKNSDSDSDEEEFALRALLLANCDAFRESGSVRKNRSPDLADCVLNVQRSNSTTYCGITSNKVVTNCATMNEVIPNQTHRETHRGKEVEYSTECILKNALLRLKNMTSTDNITNSEYGIKTNTLLHNNSAILAERQICERINQQTKSNGSSNFKVPSQEKKALQHAFSKGEENCINNSTKNTNHLFEQSVKYAKVNMRKIKKKINLIKENADILRNHQPAKTSKNQGLTVKLLTTVQNHTEQFTNDTDTPTSLISDMVVCNASTDNTTEKSLVAAMNSQSKIMSSKSKPQVFTDRTSSIIRNKVIKPNAIHYSPSHFILRQKSANMPTSKSEMNTSTSVTTTKTNSRLITSTNMPNIQIKRLVINVDPSDSEEDELRGGELIMSKNSTPLRLMCNEPINLCNIHSEDTTILLEKRIDDFLRNIRTNSVTSVDPVLLPLQINAKNSQFITPVAVKHLPKTSQEEYLRLVHRMNLLQQQKQDQIHVRKSPIPDKHLTETNTELKIKTAHSVDEREKPDMNCCFNASVELTELSKRILSHLDASLKLVRKAAHIKKAKIDSEQRLNNLRTLIEKEQQHFKMQQKTLLSITPTISKSNSTIAVLKQKRLKLVKIVNGLAETNNNFKDVNVRRSCNEHQQEITMKSKQLAANIKSVNSMKVKVAEEIGTIYPVVNERNHLLAQDHLNTVITATFPIDDSNNIGCKQPFTQCQRKIMSIESDIADRCGLKAQVTQRAENSNHNSFQGTENERLICPIPIIESKTENLCDSNSIRSDCFHEYISPLSFMTEKSVKLYSNGIICPYELMGECKDVDCTYSHFDSGTTNKSVVS